MSSFDRKAAQYCAAIERAIALALACDVEDPFLDGLVLDHVQKAENGTYVAVLFSRGTWDDIAKQHEHLRDALPVFRTALADALTRKRVPTLSFVVLPFSKESASVDEEVHIEDA